MSFQLLEEDAPWEEQTDRMLINLPVVGSAFKKSYSDPTLGHNVSELVLSRDLVMDYYAKSVEACGRKTHIIPFSRNDLHERMVSGTFRDLRDAAWYQEPPAPQVTEQQAAANKRLGVDQPQADEITPFVGLEQHCSLDLDGDGYAEPYIITIEESSKAVLRIVTRFDRESDILRNIRGEIVSIRPMEYFTKYTFIPSPDGGIYDLGFGVFLGPLNESVNSLINQLIDTGTMSATAGGFLGRGAKIRGGVYTFAPLEWKRVDATVDDLNKAIYPLPVREPSPVLFNLLALLINYANRIPGTTDVILGENPGQNTPAETSRNMVSQGMKVFSVIFKRVWRSMKGEFKKLYILNSIYLPTKKTYGPNGQIALREDYLADPNSVVPVADPNVASEEMNIARAQMLRAAARESAGYDVELVERNFLRALKIEGADRYFPGTEAKPPAPHPRVVAEQMKLQGKQIDAQAAQSRQKAQIMLRIVELHEERRINDAKILELTAKATLAMEQAGGVKAGHDIAAFEAAIGAIKTHNDNLIKQAETLMEAMKNDRDAGERGMAGVAKAPGDQGALPSPVPMGGGA
jgi:chaperonin GroES